MHDEGMGFLYPIHHFVVPGRNNLIILSFSIQTVYGSEEQALACWLTVRIYVKKGCRLFLHPFFCAGKVIIRHSAVWKRRDAYVFNQRQSSDLLL